MRIFAVSDLHLDYEENARWLAQLSEQDFTEDALILAGDISDGTEHIASCFRHLTRKFRLVFYVPGNHELWVRKDENKHSVAKFYDLLNLANHYGIHTQPKTIGQQAPITIVPLFSWYDLTFGKIEKDLFAIWMDFKCCRWPAELSEPAQQNDFFLQKNNLPIPRQGRVISFSHFLPRIDLMPAYIPEKFRKIYPVLGSKKLDQLVRALGSTTHIYGHSHVNRDINIQGVRYINSAFGYPSENRISAKQLALVTTL